jgi:hypothetical protein
MHFVIALFEVSAQTARRFGLEIEYEVCLSEG